MNIMISPPLKKYNSIFSLLQSNGCTIFLLVTLNLHKWPRHKVRTYFRSLTIFFCVKFLLLIIFHYKLWPRRNYAFITITLNFHKWSCVKIMTHPQITILAIFVWKKNFLCFYIRKIKTGIIYALFLPVTLNLPKWRWVKLMTHPHVINNLCAK